MAKKIVGEDVSDSVLKGTEHGEVDNVQTMADTLVIVFNGKLWQTPDGRCFNTRLKAEKYLMTINRTP
jgi:hypothetical protein